MVHPHYCGEIVTSRSRAPIGKGSAPSVRGNPGLEPIVRLGQVLPRVSGVHRGRQAIADMHSGSSPLMRPNPADCDGLIWRAGSIPAHAA